MAAKLAHRYGADVIALDDFARPGTSTWEHERFIVEVLIPVLAGQSASYQRWPTTAPHPLGSIKLSPDKPLIVEGVSALSQAVTGKIGRWWDFSIWVDTPFETRRERLASRDGDLTRWENSWWPSEQAYFRSERPDLLADFVASGSGQRSVKDRPKPVGGWG